MFFRAKTFRSATLVIFALLLIHNPAYAQQGTPDVSSLPLPTGAESATKSTTQTAISPQTAKTSAPEVAETPLPKASLPTKIGRLHPLVIHFPIAFILAALLAQGIVWLGGKPFWREFGQVCFGLGTLGAIVAASLGWLMAGTQDFSDSGWLLNWHRWLGVSTALLSIVTWAAGHHALKKNSKPAYATYVTGLILCTITVSLGSHLGGAMTWGGLDFLYR